MYILNFINKIDKTCNRHSMLLFWCIMLLLSIIYYHGMLFRPTYGMHQWAQGDRLSLALNFYDDLTSFFLPKTHNIYPVDRVVGVEFPLQAYISAILARPFGEAAVIPIFRLLNICIALSGMYALFLIGLKITKNVFSAFTAPFFLWTSPVFVFYSGTYLSDASAVSIVFVATLFMLRFIAKLNPIDAFLTLFFLSIAMLIKMSTGVYFLSGTILTLIVWIRDKRKLGSVFILYLFSILIVLVSSYIYLRHIQHLNIHYKSVLFLSNIAPLKGAVYEMYLFAISVLKRWGLHFFTPVHYLWIVVGIIVSAFVFKKLKTSVITVLWGSLWLASGLLIYILMGSQFYDHDYYAIAAIIPFTGYAILNIAIVAGRFLRPFLTFSLLAFLTFSLFFYFPKQQERTSFSNNVWVMKADFTSNPIPKGSTILMEANEIGDAPNTALVYINRPGVSFAAADFSRRPPLGLADHMMKIGAEFLVIGPDFSSYLDSVHPCFENIFPIYFEHKDYRVHQLDKNRLAPLWKRDEIKLLPSWNLKYDQDLHCFFYWGDSPPLSFEKRRWSDKLEYTFSKAELTQFDSVVYECDYFVQNWPDSKTIQVYINFYDKSDTLVRGHLSVLDNSDRENKKIRVSRELLHQNDSLRMAIFLDNYNSEELYLKNQKVYLVR